MTEHIIPNQYIIVFKSDIPKDRCQEHCQWATELHTQRISARSADSDAPETSGVLHHYSFPTWNGYAGSFDEDSKNEIESREEVLYSGKSTVSLTNTNQKGYRSTSSSQTTRSIPKPSSLKATPHHGASPASHTTGNSPPRPGLHTPTTVLRAREQGRMSLIPAF